MKVQPRDAEAFCAKPPADLIAVLLYGPDGGLVRERAAKLRASVVPDPGDPFRLTELTADGLKSDPAQLRDEAQAMAFGGGRRAISLRDAGDGLAKLFQDFLRKPSGDALVIVEAGDLGPRGLRKVFEDAKQAAAIACYRDEGEALKTLIRQHLAAENLRLAPEALDYLATRLGGDRRLTRQELDKLALYKGPGAGARIELEEAQAVIGDTAERTLDDLVLAVGGGDLPAALRDLGRAWAEGTAPIALLRAVSRHIQRLHLLSGAIAAGARPQDAVQALRPPVFWKYRFTVAEQAGTWSGAHLGRALGRLLETEANCKKTAAPARLLTERLLVELTARAPRRR